LIRVYDDPRNVIATHEHKGEFKGAVKVDERFMSISKEQALEVFHQRAKPFLREALESKLPLSSSSRI
jgi:hypothetical protein